MEGAQVLEDSRSFATDLFQCSFYKTISFPAFQVRRKSKYLPKRRFFVQTTASAVENQSKGLLCPLLVFPRTKRWKHLRLARLSHVLVSVVLDLVYWMLTYSYRGLLFFFCCSVPLRCLAFFSLLLLTMMLCRQLSSRPFSASRCSDLRIRHNICVKNDPLSIFVLRKYPSKWSSCPLQFFSFLQCGQGQFLQYDRGKEGYV